YDGAPFVHCFSFFSSLHDFVKRYPGYIQRLKEPVVVEVAIVLALTHIGTHAYGVQYEVDLASEDFHRTGEQVYEVLLHCRVRGYDFRFTLAGQFVDLTHAHRNGCVGKDELATFFLNLQSRFPGNRILVEGSKDDSLLALQQVISHSMIIRFMGEILQSY